VNEIYIVAAWSDGSVSHEAIQLVGRFPSKPKGEWVYSGELLWTRQPTDSTIEYELSRTEMRRAQLDNLALVHWRRLTQSEHDLFGVDRVYRNALVDRNGKIEHDLLKARECHRSEIRRHRRNAMLELDGRWMGATGQGKKKEADAIEAERQKWRDAPADPRIEAAKSVEELKTLVVD